MEPSHLRLYNCIICNEKTDNPDNHFRSQRFNSNFDIKSIGNKRKAGLSYYDDLFFDRDCDFKRNRAEHIMKGLSLELVDIEFKYEKNSFKIAALINEKASQLINQFPNSLRSSLNGRISFQNDEAQKIQNFTALYLQSTIKKSNFSRNHNILGSHTEFNEDIENMFENPPPPIDQIVNVFSGSILATEDFALLVLSAEIYSRNEYLDAHTERSGDSFPENLRNTKKYQNLKVCITKDGEEGNPISKLNIGTKHFNILVTGSLIIYPAHDSSVSFGPVCHPKLKSVNLQDTSLFLLQNNLDKLKENANQVKTIHMVRQLNSAFDHPSTHFCYRSTMFENFLRQPATLFTLYMLPNNDYGSSSTSSCREI